MPPGRRSSPSTTTRRSSRAIVRDLRSRYGSDYRVVRATSGDEALGVLAELALRVAAGRPRSSPTSGCRA